MDKLIEKLSRFTAVEASHDRIPKEVQHAVLGLGASALGLLAVVVPSASLTFTRGFRPNDCPFNPGSPFKSCSTPAPYGSCTGIDGVQCCGTGDGAYSLCQEYCDCNNNCYYSCQCVPQRC